MRVDTGIIGLDELIDGGFLPGKTYLVSGATGTGKTTFSMQYLVTGAKKGEPCLFVTLGEAGGYIKEYMGKFEWKLSELINEGKIKILDLTPLPKGEAEKYYITEMPELTFNVDTISGIILNEINELSISRVAVDSVTAMVLTNPDEFKLRHELLAFITMLEKSGCTSILTAESMPGYADKHALIEFITHGLIQLDYPVIRNEHVRTLTVKKMRGTNHDKGIYLYDIGKEGIRITSKAEYLQ
jgi:KaiC/GvpD/RAD55 family RecA-like ATPase